MVDHVLRIAISHNGPPPIKCTYDNPKSRQRESWRDGKCVRVDPAIQVNTPNSMAYEWSNMGLYPWSPGMVIGDQRAMKEPANG